MRTAIKARQDEKLSLAAGEFLWTEGGLSQVHYLLQAPVVNLLRRHTACTILDLGSGNGAFSNCLHEAGFYVEGVDGSRSGIEIARNHFPDVQFSEIDLVTDTMPDSYTNKFDAVVSIEVIEHLLLPRKLIEKALQTLKPGGLLVLSTPYHGFLKNLAIAVTNGFDAHWHPLRDYGHIKFFSKHTLLQLFEEYLFENIQFKTVGRIPPLACSLIVSGVKP
jgi:2-polyprenyl-3-methyl-5-hydroxy-6-metoxy-1,4-benzoquinol methylase